MKNRQVVAKQQTTNVKVFSWPLAAKIPPFLPAAGPCGPGGPAPAYTCAQAETTVVDTLTCVHMYCTYVVYIQDVLSQLFIRWQTYECADLTEFVGTKVLLIIILPVTALVRHTSVEWNMKWSCYHSNTTQYTVNTVAHTYHLFCIIVLPRQQVT